MKTNLEWFRTFKAIYETGTLTKAADYLSISQPGVSLHLSSLETYTGYPLFERKSKRMIPTEKGTILYHQVENLLDCFDEVEKLLHKKPGNIRPSVSLGMCAEIFQCFLEKHVPSLPFNLIVRFESDENLKQLLEKGILDVIITKHKTNEKELDYAGFFHEKLVLVAGRDENVQSLKEKLRQWKMDEAKHWLKDQIWYGTAADMEHIQRFWHTTFNENPNFSPNYIVPNKFSIVRCLSQANGFSILPEYLCRNTDSALPIQIVKTPKTVENKLFFCKKKKSQYDSEIGTIAGLLHRGVQQWEVISADIKDSVLIPN